MSPVACGMQGCVQADSTGMELNCRTSCRCQRTGWCEWRVERRIGSSRATQWRSVRQGWKSLPRLWASSVLLFLVPRQPAPGQHPALGVSKDKFSGALSLQAAACLSCEGGLRGACLLFPVLDQSFCGDSQATLGTVDHSEADSSSAVGMLGQ